jgi:hypothetical protein
MPIGSAGELHVISLKKKCTRRDQESTPRPNPLHYISTYYKTETKYNLDQKKTSPDFAVGLMEGAN